MVRSSLYPAMNFGLCCAGLLAGIALSVPKVNRVQAIQYRDGTTAFLSPLRMIEARTTRNIIAENNPTYYIRFAFPAAAEEPLDRIVISLDRGVGIPNPRFEGGYLFGVNAYPVGQRVEPNFVGYARLSFFSTREGFWP